MVETLAWPLNKQVVVYGSMVLGRSNSVVQIWGMDVKKSPNLIYIVYGLVVQNILRHKKVEYKSQQWSKEWKREWQKIRNEGSYEKVGRISGHEMLIGRYRRAEWRTLGHTGLLLWKARCLVIRLSICPSKLALCTGFLSGHLSGTAMVAVWVCRLRKSKGCIYIQYEVFLETLILEESIIANTFLCILHPTFINIFGFSW